MLDIGALDVAGACDATGLTVTGVGVPKPGVLVKGAWVGI